MKNTGHIEVLARGVCVKDGKILLCHTKGAENTYLPGGHIEFSEPAKESLRREIEEELGVVSHVVFFMGVVEHKFIQKGDLHCEVNFIFMIDIPGIETRCNPDSREDYIEFLWVFINELSESVLEPSALRSLLPLWLSSKRGHEYWASSYPEHISGS